MRPLDQKAFDQKNENERITAFKQYCLAPAHAGQHKATSPTRKPLVPMLKKKKRLRIKDKLNFYSF